MPPQFFTGQPRNPVIAQAFAGLDSTQNRTKQLQGADARTNFDSGFDLRNPYYQELYARQGNPFESETQGQMQQRRQVAATTAQQAEDYDLEYNQPNRSMMQGDIKRDEGMRDAQTKSDIYFDPSVARQRQGEFDQSQKEIEMRYVQPRIAEAEGRARAAELAAAAAIQSAELRKQGITGAAQIRGDADVARQAMRGFTDAGIARGFTEPDSFSATQGELQARMPGVDNGAVTPDVNAAADEIVRRFPNLTGMELRAQIDELFDPSQISQAERWLLEQEINRRRPTARGKF